MSSIFDQHLDKNRANYVALLQEGMTVMDPETMREVPADGRTTGEIMFRGNI